MKNYSKTGGRKGRPAYRTPSWFKNRPVKNYLRPKDRRLKKLRQAFSGAAAKRARETDKQSLEAASLIVGNEDEETLEDIIKAVKEMIRKLSLSTS